MEKIIEINNVKKSFNNIKVLDGVTLSISKGEIYGLLGHRPSRAICRGDGIGGVRAAYGRILLRRFSARQIREKKRCAPNGSGSFPYQYFL